MEARRQWRLVRAAGRPSHFGAGPRPRRADAAQWRHARRRRILSPQSVERLLTPVWRFDGRNGDTDHGFYCSYGLATQQIPSARAGCNDDPAGDGSSVGHAGEAYGLRSGLWIDRVDGTGVAYFVTGLSDDPPRGSSAYRAAEEAAFKRSLQLLGKGPPCGSRRKRAKEAGRLHCRFAAKVSMRTF